VRVLITGGAGFVGSNLALAFKDYDSKNQIDVFDNHKRRGSELKLNRLKRHGIRFVHGDLRTASDLDELEGNYDLLIDAAAEPSVLAGVDSAPAYVLDTNLRGSLNTFEFARKRAPNIVFLSTSRVYSIANLRAIPLFETGGKFQIGDETSGPGFSAKGINEGFNTNSFRSFYGFTKLASEYALQEYAESYRVKAIINRCGVIAGPGQFGKSDQGVFTMWMANHYFGRGLAYHGYGGQGFQVRDLLHPQDLFDLLLKQIATLSQWNAQVFNVGGGKANAVSLSEYTKLCQTLSGKEVAIGSQEEFTSVDVPYYVTDNSKVSLSYKWAPKISSRDIATDTLSWIKANEAQLKDLWQL
jgi:CDP-paratose 2-epimerase